MNPRKKSERSDDKNFIADCGTCKNWVIIHYINYISRTAAEAAYIDRIDVRVDSVCVVFKKWRHWTMDIFIWALQGQK